MASSFSRASAGSNSTLVALHELAVPIVKRAWPSISHAASNYNFNESISLFLTIRLPPVANSDAAIELLSELFALSIPIVQSESIGHTGRRLIGRHDYSFREKSALATLKSSRSVKLLSCLKLGNAQENERQGNGQSAFEIKTASKNPGRQALAAMFPLLQVSLETGLFLLLSLTVSPGEDRRGDRLARRAVEASVSCNLEPDAETTSSTMSLLEATVNLAQSVAVEEIRHVVEDILSRALSDSLTSLIVGGCGKLDSTSLDNAARLLRCILMAWRSLEEIKSNLVHAIGNENVFLGVRGPRYGWMDPLIQKFLTDSSMEIEKFTPNEDLRNMYY
eukprot:scaffold891_cov82-Cylindrotheca_fusiformis.AAC.2